MNDRLKSIKATLHFTVEARVNLNLKPMERILSRATSYISWLTYRAIVLWYVYFSLSKSICTCKPVWEIWTDFVVCSWLYCSSFHLFCLALGRVTKDSQCAVYSKNNIQKAPRASRVQREKQLFWTKQWNTCCSIREADNRMLSLIEAGAQ